MRDAIFVTGATGNVGREVVNNLLERGARVIAAGTAREGAAEHENPVFRPFDFTDPDTWDACLEDANRVFLMRPPHLSNIRRDMYPFLAHLRERQISQVVFLSVQGAERNSLVPHHKVERYLAGLGLPSTMVRPSFFMQNLTTTHLAELRDDSMLLVPAGNGRTNFIDVRDIAEIVALMFLDTAHVNKAYTVTGERSYSYAEVAGLLAQGLGREVNYVNPNMLRFFSYHLKRGRSLAMTLVMFVLYSVVKSGRADISTGSAQALLGRRMRSLEAFIQDHRNLLNGAA